MKMVRTKVYTKEKILNVAEKILVVLIVKLS